MASLLGELSSHTLFLHYAPKQNIHSSQPVHCKLNHYTSCLP